ncbi:GNAT family N-acetyltransferase [Actinoplanes bogorensis]|uniref:GNAT family N-acetyltransferase n=1 Tax=Paractinoplanes bogorensis TaxID=1610840 RepID=A0ABS5Z3A3_9ACTN|nr:GNAT family N-acetyltransferase [Actinoplanes bogorensis]MBU2670127.1 GNAT family N-acetyltransferase [Actinoplanes bogorensis]
MIVERARALWVSLAGVPVGFRASAVEVVVSPKSLLCPPGWVGIVVVGDGAIATAPDGAAAGMMERALADLDVSAMSDPAVVGTRIAVDEVLGPATLAYCDAATFRPVDSGAIESIPADDAELNALIARVPADEAGEAGLDEITSPAFVVRQGSELLAAAGYRDWPLGTAHLSVLTAPEARGRGLAKAVASAAVAAALDAGRFPQWRARPVESRQVARALGFVEVGAQLSLRLKPPRLVITR